MAQQHTDSASNKTTMAAQKSSSSSLTHDLLAAVDDGDLVNVTKLLKSPGLSINSTNKHGESPLHIAAGYGRLNIVKLLRKHGASLDIRDKQGDTPLYWAARHGHLNVVQYLCEMGATSLQDSTGETALHISARYGHPDVLAHLCRVGLDLDITDNDGDTPLLCGCWHGYQHVVECLVKAGCALHARNKEGETALHIAAVRGYYNIVRLLCESGADLDKQDNAGCTALHLATRRNHLDIVQYLCERGCNLNIQDNNGDTALHDACREGQLSIFYTLYAAKCNLDIPNKNGATPLHLAAKYGHMELVRHLCLAGCDVNAATEHGFTADEVAANSSHDRLATFIHHLRQDGLRDHYVRELMLGQVPMGRAKLLVCGAAGVGKTELIDSLKCHLLRSLFRKRSASNLAQMILKRTHGMNIQQVTIPNEGDFSIWDFSGMKEYYTSHEYFLSTNNSILLLVFSLREPIKKQIAQVRFWLAMIKSKQPLSEKIRFAGQNPHKPHVILVGSFVDEQLPPTTGATAGGGSGSQSDESEDVFAVPLASSILEPAPLVEPDNGKTVLKVLAEEFKDEFVFPKRVVTLDCRLSQTREMKLLRQQLGELRREVIKHQSWNPVIVETLSQALVTWRRDHSDFPVLTWELFHRKTQELINPLVSEDRMKIATSALHDMGEVIYINEGALHNIVILDPSWYGLMIIGPALSPENSVVSQLKSVTGRIKMSSLQHVYPDVDATSILHLLEHFQLCTPLQDEPQPTYLFPCLIKMQPLFGLWVKDPTFVVYAGVILKCRGASDIFTPGCFPRIQVAARRCFSDDIDDQELTLWSNGFKCCRGEVEVYVDQCEPNKTIEVVVRGTGETRMECHSLLQQFYNIAVDTIRTTNPGTHFTTHILSSKRLREHKEPIAYSAVEVFEAERGDGLLRCSELEESILDTVCCGCEELLIAAKSAPYTSLRDVPLQTRVELCRMLDPREPFGRDWCLLALQLGISEEVPEIDQINDHSSPTDKLLTVWEKGVSSTVVTVIDALRGIGREDCAQVVIEGLSLFSNATSSIVINVPGIGLTSYVC